MRPYFLFMGMWLVLFLLLYGALELAGNTSALEIALIGSFFVSLIFPVRSFGILIIFVGVLLSGFQQFVGINVVLYYAPEIFKTMGAGHRCRFVAADRGRSCEPLFYRTGYLYGRPVRTPSAYDYRGIGHGRFDDDLGDDFLYALRRYRLVGLHVGVHGWFRDVVGAGLLGIAGRDFPEYDPFDCYEYCRCRAVDCQFPCLLDFPDAR